MNREYTIIENFGPGILQQASNLDKKAGVTKGLGNAAKNPDKTIESGGNIVSSGITAGSKIGGSAITAGFALSDKLFSQFFGSTTGKWILFIIIGCVIIGALFYLFRNK